MQGGYAGTRHEIFKKDRSSTSVGQVSADPLTWADPTTVTAGAASGVLLAAAAGTGRTVWLKVPVSAATGICVNFGAAATTSDMLIEPGETIFLATEQEIRCIRAGTGDVTVYITSGVVS